MNFNQHKKALGNFGNKEYALQEHERENEQPQVFQRNYKDDRRRGDFIPTYKKLSSMPIRVNQNNQYGE